MSYNRIVEAMVGCVWAMEPDKLYSVANVIASRAGGVNVDVTQVQAVVGERDAREAQKALGTGHWASVGGGGGSASYQVAGSVAVIGIGGMIAKRASMVNQASTPKGTSIDQLRGQFRAACREVQAGNLGAIALRIDSPGGMVDGVADMADEIHAARSAGVPIWAYADGTMASAAYLLGSQADRVEASQDASVGSIGTYTVAMDSSRKAENEGIKVHVIRSAPFKGVGVDGTSIPQAALDKAQKRINAHNESFLAAVTRGRGLTGERLAAVTDGGTLMGKEALAAGLVDGVRTIEAMVAEMNQRFPARNAESRQAGGVGVAAKTAGRTEVMKGRSGSGVGNVLAMAGAALAANAFAGDVSNMNGQRVGAGGIGGAGSDDFPAVDLHGLDGVYGDESAGQGGGGEGAQPQNGTAAQQGAGSRGAPEGAQPHSGTAAQQNAAVVPVQANAPALRLVGTDEAVEAALRANDSRIAEIRAACRGFEHVAAVTAIATRAITDRSITVDSARAQVLEAVRGHSQPAGGVDLQVGRSGWDRERQAHELMLVSRLAPAPFQQIENGGARGNDVARVLGFDDAQAALREYRQAEANGLRRVRLIDLAQRCAGARGGGARGFRNEHEILAAAYGHSSSDFPNLLAAGANKALMAYFGLTPTTYGQWCGIGSANDFKAQNLVTISNLGNLKLTPEGGPITQTSFNERKETITLGTYTRGFSFTRQMIINDDLGGVQRVLQYWGVVSALTPEILAYSVLNANAALADGVALFHATHRNLAGANAALSQSEVEKAMAAMMLQKEFGPDTNYLMVQPKYLLTPVELWGTATRICTNPTDAATATANSNLVNPVRGMLTPIWSPWLSGTSATAWYLVGDPNLYPLVQVNFLNGQRNPILTQVGNGSVMGQEFEVIFDCGAKGVQFEAGYKNAGA